MRTNEKIALIYDIVFAFKLVYLEFVEVEKKKKKKRITRLIAWKIPTTKMKPKKNREKKKKNTQEKQMKKKTICHVNQISMGYPRRA